MEIGSKIKALRLRKGLTQEELGERTNLTKGYISQLERDLNSPSIETLFSILEVLGTTPKEFFDDGMGEPKIVYPAGEQTNVYSDDDKKYSLRWLIPTSNEKEMEPVLITLAASGEFKRFEPSLAETFIYVLKGKIRLLLGEEPYVAHQGDSLYYEAKMPHQVVNASDGETRILLIATHSYL
ncbi:helix-turn-helix domain-containing protein [Cohnella caldifontis]|uniref:helix-turn-helix domain-containing protein n=1 Tax=Cohnella caldifontis TaxID=3027471 RepID=UPI0023EBC6FA|nr:XRE family transcriptional regulator [Cohnella sp. YIM B05605]